MSSNIGENWNIGYGIYDRLAFIKFSRSRYVFEIFELIESPRKVICEAQRTPFIFGDFYGDDEYFPSVYDKKIE